MHITSPSDAVALGIATVYQDLALCDNLDVVENLFLGREEMAGGPPVLAPLDEMAMEQRTGELLENLAVTITDVRAEVGTMSGGQRQQVAIARSLLGEPKLVMLDEPTAALGVRQTAQVLALVKRLRERGHGVVVISHNLADVFEVADRIFVLRLGREAGDFKAGEASQEQVVGAITGAGAAGNGGGTAMSTADATVDEDVEVRSLGMDVLRRFIAGDLGELRVLLALALIWLVFQIQEPASSPRPT